MRPLLTNFLGSMTMYALMVRFLLGVLAIAFVLALGEKIPFSAAHILTTTLAFVVCCFVFNALLTRFFKVKPNPESWLITALILSLVIGPSRLDTLWVAILASSFAAMASKYLFRLRARHIFNPAVLGIVVMHLATSIGSSWWVGVMPLTVLVIAGGILIGYKIRRLRVSLAYVASFLLLFFVFNGTQLNATDNISLLRGILLNSPLFFFAFVMLIEPTTAPTNRRLGYAYAIFVALLGIVLQRFAPNVPYSLELSLLAGNLLTRVIERVDNFTMRLAKRVKLASKIEEFVFEAQPKVHFSPGQFIEWTLPHPHPDDRGVRRWFTVSSSPTEKYLLLTTRFSAPSSSFKTALSNLQPGAEISARGVEGDFILPDDKTRPLVFIAGGIGITPFRSMIKFLLDTGEQRDVILIYAAKTVEDLVFIELFQEAREAFGLKIVCVLSEAPKNFHAYSGQIDAKIIKDEVPDLKHQLFYVSGPEPMVEAIERLLVQMDIPKSNIRQDFFPGYPNDLLSVKPRSTQR